MQVDSLPTELPGKSKLHVNHKSKTYSRRTNTQKIVVIVCCSVVSDSVIPWTAAHQASLSCTISWSLLKPISIESVIPSNHLIFCHPLLLLSSVFPTSGIFHLFASGGQSIGASASASVLPMNILLLLFSHSAVSDSL